MPFNEALFWVGLTVAGTGGYFWVEGEKRRILSIVLTVFGCIVMAYSVYIHDHPEIPRPRGWVSLLLITWVALVWSAFDRRRRSHSQPKPQSESDIIEEGRQRSRRHQIRTHVQNIVQNHLMQSHDAMETAVRAAVGKLPTGDRLSGELARAYEYLLEDFRHERADLNVAANRSLQDAPEEDKLSVDMLVDKLVNAVSIHFRLWRALEGLTLVPDVLLARLPELARARDVREQLKSELRTSAHADGFGAIRHLSEHLRPSGIPPTAPRIVPVRYGRMSRQRAEEGLFLANLGDPARSVVAQQVRLGKQIVTFDGPEIAQLRREDGERFVDVTIERAPNDISIDLSESFRDWQQELGDLTRETVGVITYMDFEGRRYETYYRIGIDVQNRDGGMVVEFIEQRQL